MSPRGAGWLFGSKVVSEFNYINNLDLIARAHQLVMDGYKYWFDKQLVTVWSAPNYMYRCGNAATFLKINEQHEQNFEIFTASEDQKTKAVDYKTIVPYFL